MATPVYETDLITSLVGNEVTETWDESSDAGYDDGGAMVDDGNLYYINTNCVSAQFTKAGVGSIIGSIGSDITVPTDGAILIHHLWAAPPALATLANGGVRVLIGDSFGDFDVWYVSGTDTMPSEGGWQTYVIDPTTTPQGATVGAPTTISYVGGCISATEQARGNPHAVNAIRYGRCEQRYTLGEVADPAKFSGYSVVDYTATTKYNLLRPSDGAFIQRGLVSLGTTATAVYFSDSNVEIKIANDANVSANFNLWQVNNASSEVYMDTVSIKSLSTTSKGRFVVVDNAIVQKISCTFTDMDYFTYQSNSTLTTTTYRRCGLVTTGGGSFIGSIFEASTASSATLTSELSDLDGCKFTKGTTGHAVELDSIGAGSMTWSATTTGYETGATGSPITPTSTGDEDIYINVATASDITINVATGASVPSIRVGASFTGNVNVVAGLVDFTFTVSPSITDYEYHIYSVTAKGSLEGQTELQGLETATTDSYTYTYTYSTPDAIAVQIIADPDDITHDFEESVTYYNLSATNQSVTINLKTDINN